MIIPTIEDLALVLANAGRVNHGRCRLADRPARN